MTPTAPEIPGYEILNMAGRGGMANVWKARQLSLDRIVAIKVLNENFASDPEEVQRFIREARAAARLKHGTIVQIFEAAQHDGMFFFTMEYVAGPTVAEMLTKRKTVAPKRALRIARYVGAALDYAWNEASLIHRDIKPGNIMIESKTQAVKVTDLGLAIDPGQERATYIEGTPNYISPEQGNADADIDCRADIYSLGATLYHMLTGHLPFGHLDGMDAIHEQVDGHLPNPRSLNPKLNVTTAQLVLKMMMKDPNHRFRDWPTTIAEIKKAEAGRIVIMKDRPHAESTVYNVKQQPRRRRRFKVKQKERLPVWAALSCWAAMILAWIVLAYKLLQH